LGNRPLVVSILRRQERHKRQVEEDAVPSGPRPAQHAQRSDRSMFDIPRPSSNTPREAYSMHTASTPFSRCRVVMAASSIRSQLMTQTPIPKLQKTGVPTQTSTLSTLLRASVPAQRCSAKDTITTSMKSIMSESIYLYDSKICIHCGVHQNHYDKCRKCLVQPMLRTTTPKLMTLCRVAASGQMGKIAPQSLIVHRESASSSMSFVMLQPLVEW
jgi:ribosomal protein L40E